MYVCDFISVPPNDSLPWVQRRVTNKISRWLADQTGERISYFRSSDTP